MGTESVGFKCFSVKESYTEALLSMEQTMQKETVFNSEGNRGPDAHACMNFLCFYTSLVHSSLSTGGIIYNPVLLLNTGKRGGLHTEGNTLVNMKSHQRQDISWINRNRGY